MLISMPNYNSELGEISVTFKNDQDKIVLWLLLMLKEIFKPCLHNQSDGCIGEGNMIIMNCD